MITRIGRLLLAVLAMALCAGGARAESLVDLIHAGDRDAAVRALEAGADVNALADDGSSALLWAVYKVDRELIAALLKRGADPDLRNVLGATALTEAIDAGDERVARMLLDAGADPELGNEDGQTPLLLAARLGQLPMVELLVKAGAKVNARENYREQTPLMWAVGAGHADVVRYLIHHGAEVEVRAATNDWGNQITSEPRAQYRAAGGHTPLLIAARAGCTECTRVLLDAGVNIDRPTPEGVTPLMLAIDNGNYETASMLLDAGANPNICDWWGRTALYVAIDMSSRGAGAARPGAAASQQAEREKSDAVTGDVAAVRFADAPAPRVQFSALQIAQRLLEAGVDPDTQLNMHRPGRGANSGRFTDDLMTTGCTPLLRAAGTADRRAVELLLQHGAAADLPNVMGVTPLMAAAGIGYGLGSSRAGVAALGPDPEANAMAIIEMLVKAGADVNARIADTTSHTAIIARPSAMTDREGQTAIFGTISRGWPRVTKLLLENGARVDVKDNAGRGLREALEGKAGGRDDPAAPEIRQVLLPALNAL